jgi:hypothetical protein
MGTRSTQTVGAAVATRAIEAALRSGKLSLEALSNLLEAVDDDLNAYGMANFRIVEGEGEHDEHWVGWTRELEDP